MKRAVLLTLLCLPLAACDDGKAREKLIAQGADPADLDRFEQNTRWSYNDILESQAVRREFANWENGRLSIGAQEDHAADAAVGMAVGMAAASSARASAAGER